MGRYVNEAEKAERYYEENKQLRTENAQLKAELAKQSEPLSTLEKPLNKETQIVRPRYILAPKSDFFLCEFSVLILEFDYVFADVDDKIIIKFKDLKTNEEYSFDTNLLWTTFHQDDNILIMTKKSRLELTVLITKKYP